MKIKKNNSVVTGSNDTQQQQIPPNVTPQDTSHQQSETFEDDDPNSVQVDTQMNEETPSVRHRKKSSSATATRHSERLQNKQKSQHSKSTTLASGDNTGFGK